MFMQYMSQVKTKVGHKNINKPDNCTQLYIYNKMTCEGMCLRLSLIYLLHKD